MEIHIVKA
jgi:hypothetical protein